VEILPGGIEDLPVPAGQHHPFLLMDGHLGIPQKLLYAIHMLSSREFPTHRRAFLSSGAVTTGLITSTTLLIVANPAHQTAFNVRKKLIGLGELLAPRDLDLTAALLAGSKESAKSSIVWDHRRWIFRRLHPPTNSPIISESQTSRAPELLENSLLAKLPIGVVDRELQLIARCCELYPRNYHAWTHWTFCMQSVLLTARGRYDDIVRSEYQRLLQWVDRHVSDYSAMHCVFAMWTMFHKALEDGGLPCPLRHSLALLTDYDHHEAVQLYVRECLERDAGNFDVRTISDQLSSLATFQQPRGRLLLSELQEL